MSVSEGNIEKVDKEILPSQFMRHRRPERFSDSQDKISYILDAPTLEYHLETITKRNQMHDFEVFGRKLCERAICLNLRPSTGPEGGGDSKADAETYAVSDDIAIYYFGEANSGKERWAFAYSAKEKWKEKVRSDVEGIIDTGRNYDKIFVLLADSQGPKTVLN